MKCSRLATRTGRQAGYRIYLRQAYNRVGERAQGSTKEEGISRHLGFTGFPLPLTLKAEKGVGEEKDVQKSTGAIGEKAEAAEEKRNILAQAAIYRNRTKNIGLPETRFSRKEQGRVPKEKKLLFGNTIALGWDETITPVVKFSWGADQVFQLFMAGESSVPNTITSVV